MRTTRKTIGRLAGIVGFVIVGLALTGCGTWQERVEPGNVGVLMTYNTSGEGGKPEFQVYRSGEWLWVNGWSQAWAEYNVGTNTSDFRNSDYATPYPNSEGAIDVKDQIDLEAKANVTARWEISEGNTIGVLLFEFKGLPLRVQGIDANDIETKLVRRVIETALTKETVNYAGLQFNDNRAKIEEVVLAEAKAALAKYSINLIEFNLVNFHFGPKLDSLASLAADEAKDVQTRTIKRNQDALDRAQEVDNAEADRKIALVTAQSVADAIKIKTQAEVARLQELTKALGSAELAVKYVAAEKANAVNWPIVSQQESVQQSPP